jgi:hypothetical protein
MSDYCTSCGSLAPVGYDTCRSCFLGWADDGEGVKAAPKGEAERETRLASIRQLWEQGRVKVPEGDTWQVVTGIDWAVGCEPQPTPPPRALPFVRHSKCKDDHADPWLCLRCEELIANESWKSTSRTPPARPEPHTLAPSGMCGPVMGRRR